MSECGAAPTKASQSARGRWRLRLSDACRTRGPRGTDSKIGPPRRITCRETVERRVVDLVARVVVRYQGRFVRSDAPRQAGSSQCAVDDVSAAPYCELGRVGRQSNFDPEPTCRGIGSFIWPPTVLRLRAHE